jgi:microcystin degradation protein MlrC
VRRGDGYYEYDYGDAHDLVTLGRPSIRRWSTTAPSPSSQLPSMKRVGILALMHESNTFSHERTTLQHFRDDLYLVGPPMIERLAESHHELGGFIAGLTDATLQPGADSFEIEIVPIMAARATPSGTIDGHDFEAMVQQLMHAVQSAMPLDGLLVAAHGAAVAESHADADGFWLSRLRELVGEAFPIVATLDAHANLSNAMVEACTAIIAYRTNPHLDQRQRGIEAARCMVATLMHHVQPCMAAVFPPMVINIERQCTSEPHLQALYRLADAQLQTPGVLSNSILLGFPYADVEEMGAAALVVTDGDRILARRLANELGDALWSMRESMRGVLLEVDAAMEQVAADPKSRFVLLDMGDNVGGGSAGDGTELARALNEHRIGPALVSLADAASVQRCIEAGVGAVLDLDIGGKTDKNHGLPLSLRVRVDSFHEGRFDEPQPRHGGIMTFDQGPTVMVHSVQSPLVMQLTRRRMVPFSLRQLTSCGIDPTAFRVLVAKGVHAPMAAYRDICDRFLRVNTCGSTCADLTNRTYHARRRPLFPFETLH